MNDILEFEISEKRSLSVFLDDKVITIDAYEEGEIVIKVEAVFTYDDLDCVWDNESWITNDLIDHLFNNDEYASVREAFAEARFTNEEILALKYLLTEAQERGFFSGHTLNIKK